MYAVCVLGVFCSRHVTCQIWLRLENLESHSHGTNVAKQLNCESYGFQSNNMVVKSHPP